MNPNPNANANEMQIQNHVKKKKFFKKEKKLKMAGSIQILISEASSSDEMPRVAHPIETASPKGDRIEIPDCHALHVLGLAV